MLLVIVPHILVGDEGVQPFVDVALFVTVFQKGAAVFFQLFGHVLLLLGKTGFRHVHEQVLLGPGIDVPLCEGQAVLGRHAGGDVFRQLGPHEPMLPHARHDPVAEQFGGRVGNPVHHLAGGRRHEGDEKQTFLHSPQR